jgi:hypothetical protein
MPVLNDVLAGSLAQAVQVQQIIDALKGTPNKGVPVSLVSLNDSTNYALTVQNDDSTNSRALLVLKSDGTTLIAADATGVTLGSPVNLPAGSINGGTALAAGSVSNDRLGPDVQRLNLLTNGSFEVWQRGVGPYTANGAYTADRWVIQSSGTDTVSVGRSGSADIGSIYACGVTFTLGTGAGNSALYQILKTSEHQLAGRTLSLSMRVLSNTASAVRIRISTDGTGAASAYSAFHSGNAQYATLTVGPVTVPTDATFVSVAAYFAASCTGLLDNACLVVGSQPANYVPLHPADDLARCLRYYETYCGNFTNEYLTYQWVNATANASGVLKFRVPKAVAPTVTANGQWAVQYAAGSFANATLAASSISPEGCAITLGSVVGSPLTVGQVCMAAATTTAAKLTVEANP